MENQFKKRELWINKAFFIKHERLISFIAFIAGFIFDGLTLTYVDLFEASFILALYLLVIFVCIIVFNAIGVRGVRSSFSMWVHRLIPYVIQFMFGTLFNASFIFYTVSAELSTSWPFILLVAAVVLINEIYRKRHEQLTFQMVIFFMATFLFLAFAIPLHSGKLGTGAFVLSGFFSLVILAFLAYLLNKFCTNRFNEKRELRIFAVGLIYVLINVCYFANLIPPIPLALKQIGVYHSITKIGNDYLVTYEKTPKYFFWQKESRVLHLASGEGAYVWSAVFAPGTLSVPIVHEWRRFDPSSNKWVTVSEVEFPIIGGRDGGYRGYSFIKGITEGKWRTFIKTLNDQHLGNISFEVVRASSTPLLSSGVK